MVDVLVSQWLPSLAGGLIIGVSATLLLLSIGRVAGISGMVHGLVSRYPGDVSWRVLFLAGLSLAGVVLFALRPEAFSSGGLGAGRAIAAGLLVGIGTRLGGGCTSGHGICGLSRLSPRSIVATVTFIAAGVITVFVYRQLGGLR